MSSAAVVIGALRVKLMTKLLKYLFCIDFWTLKMDA